MNNYVKPSLAKYGNSLECIEGSCGFGFENIWLDKTGATKTSTTFHKFIPVRFFQI